MFGRNKDINTTGSRIPTQISEGSMLSVIHDRVNSLKSEGDFEAHKACLVFLDLLERELLSVSELYDSMMLVEKYSLKSKD